MRRPALFAPLTASIVAALALVGCAGPAAEEPDAPATPSASPEPEATAAPTPTPTEDPTAGWQTIETEDGLFRWRIPADWSVVDESAEAPDDLGWTNQITVVSDRGQELAYFGSAYFGDRGGACGSALQGSMTDAEGFVPAVVHDDEQVALGDDLVDLEGEPVDAARLVAHTAHPTSDRYAFFAGYTVYPMRDDAVPCLQYSDVAVPEDYPYTSFGTSAAPELWDVDSFEQGTAYTETEEYEELMTMFRSLELTGEGR